MIQKFDLLYEQKVFKNQMKVNIMIVISTKMMNTEIFIKNQSFV